MSKETDQPLRGFVTQPFVTDTCDLTCNGCPYPGQPKEQKALLRSRELVPAQWVEKNNWLYDGGVRQFCIMGGEPASYQGIDEVIKGITAHPDAFVLLSTTGIHLLKDESLRERVVDALKQPVGRQFKNAFAISFDGLPYKDTSLDRSRSHKAKAGLELARIVRERYGDQITFIANVMVTPTSLPEILEIQSFLEDNGVCTNLCTQQVKCFGATDSVFDASHTPELERVAVGMLRRKNRDRFNSNPSIVNSAAFLSQLPGIIGQEDYRCWEEFKGSPVIDVGSDGSIKYCNWIGQNSEGGTPGIPSEDLMDGRVTLDEFWAQSKETTKVHCRGCSWSRRDRVLPEMVKPNHEILKMAGIDPDELFMSKYKNRWVQAQASLAPDNIYGL